jgi:hypothetical protein
MIAYDQIDEFRAHVGANEADARVPGGPVCVVIIGSAKDFPPRPG